MENQPPVHRRDDSQLDGSTVLRPTSDATPVIGSTETAHQQLMPTGGAGDSGSVVAGDALTVIRRSDSESRPQLAAGAPNTPAAVASVLLGTQLNHFLLEELIGGGGMGAVFRARDERLDRTVAIKVIPFVGDDPDLQRRFRNEAQNAARLDHPYIARVFDVGQFEQWHYIVFEHVQGVNIRDLVAREGVLSIDDAVYYTRQIAEAIEHAASRGIVHRDIKPSNVLVGVDGNVKVVDMGLARSQQLEMSGDMTASGVTLGTFDYISPEQARDPRDADVRSDIYSLGCTLYYMLTGSPPFPGGTMLQKLLSHGNTPPPDPRGLRPQVSENLTAIVHKMLAKLPEDRYQNSMDLIADLRELAIREGLVRAQSRGTLTVTTADPVPQFLLRHMPWMVASILILAIAAWLQLSSVAARSEFVLPSAANAVALQRMTGSKQTASVPATSAATESRPQSTNSATSGAQDAATASTATTTTTANALGSAPVPPVVNKSTVSDSAALPPKYTDLAMPPKSVGSSAAKPTATPADSQRIVKIVISDEPGTEPDAKFTQTLVDALNLCQEFDVNTIEIRRRVVESLPIKITRDKLDIFSSLSGGSELRFKAAEAPLMQREAMIDLGARPIKFRNLHFTWNARNTAIEGGSLMRLACYNGSVQLTDCTVSVTNRAQRDDVFAIDVRDYEGMLASQNPANASATEAQTSARTAAAKDRRAGGAFVHLILSNVAARGEMTFINLADPVQLQLKWTNGMLAVNRRMIDAAGTDTPPPLGGTPIELSLERVTVWAGAGLLRMVLGPSGPYPMTIDRNCSRSVFHHDLNIPHISIEGLNPIVTDPAKLVQLRGDENAYDFAQAKESVLLALGQWNGPTDRFRLQDLIAGSGASWFKDGTKTWLVRWVQPPLETAPSQMTASDLAQEGMRVSGFDEETLPKFLESGTVADPEI